MTEGPSKLPPMYPRVYDSLNMIQEYLEANHNVRLGKTFPSEMSCGITHISCLSQDPKITVDKILRCRHPEDKKKSREAFVIFSDLAGSDRGTEGGGASLARYIRENNLGTLLETEGRRNPNSGNTIKVWVWSPPHSSLERKNKYMPVYGKILRFTERGDFGGYRNTEKGEKDSYFDEKGNLCGYEVSDEGTDDYG